MKPLSKRTLDELITLREGIEGEIATLRHVQGMADKLILLASPGDANGNPLHYAPELQDDEESDPPLEGRALVRSLLKGRNALGVMTRSRFIDYLTKEHLMNRKKAYNLVYSMIHDGQIKESKKGTIYI